jgi:hypothetical protein
MKDFLTFRKMLTPWLVQFLFWVAMIVFIIIAIVDIIHQESWRVVLEIIILGPLATRIVCELLILFFRINDHLAAIRANTGKSSL